MIETLTIHQDLTEALATQLVDRALAAGATDAEVVLYEGDEFEALVRKGEVERLKDSGSRAAGLRVFLGARAASTSTSDLTPAGLERLVHEQHFGRRIRQRPIPTPFALEASRRGSCVSRGEHSSPSDR